jgi:uncharacterized protein
VHRIGLISDTHGLLRPACTTRSRGVELILHAGDVVGDEILDELALIAPVQAVYGNCDARGSAASGAARPRMGGVRIHVSHGHELGAPGPRSVAPRTTPMSVSTGTRTGS